MQTKDSTKEMLGRLGCFIFQRFPDSQTSLARKMKGRWAIHCKDSAKRRSHAFELFASIFDDFDILTLDIHGLVFDLKQKWPTHAKEGKHARA